MNNKKHFFKLNQAGFVLGAMLLAAASQCVGSASGAPVSTGAGAPVVNGNPPNASSGLNRPNGQNPSNPNVRQQPGNAPQQPGTVPNNNTGNGTFVNGGNGTFIQPGSPAQPGSPVVNGQNIASNNVAGQNITGPNTNQSGLDTRQQYNQQGWMTNRPPLQTNDSHLQPWMTNHPSIPTGNTNMPPQ